MKPRHPFSYTLGPGPYRYLGEYDLGAVLAALNAGNINGYNAGLSMAPKDVSVGTCAHCGRPILMNYIIQTGDGQRHAVGSECILKAHGQGDGSELSQAERAIRLAKRRKGQEQREARRMKQAAQIAQLIETKADVLRSLPHPSKFHPNKSALDYVVYCYRNGHISLGGIKYLKAKLAEWGVG